MLMLPLYKIARLRRKVNFAPGKIPLQGKSPQKCIYSVPAQETAKHRAKFGWLPERRHCSNEAKMRNPLKFAGVSQTNEPNSATSGPSSSYCEDMGGDNVV